MNELVDTTEMYLRTHLRPRGRGRDAALRARIARRLDQSRP